MNMFYNAVLPAQSPSKGSYVYHLPLGSPRKKKYMGDNDFFCCSGSCVEAFSQLGGNIYFHDDDAVWVNLYVPSKVVWKEKRVELSQSGDLAKEMRASLSVSVERKTDFTLKLLVPSWTRGADVYVNGERMYVEKRDGASYVDLTRNWEDDDRVEVVFHPDFHVKPLPGGQNTFAIFYGPVMLAFETNAEIVLKSDIEEVVGNLSVVNGREGTFRLSNDGKTYTLRPLSEIDEQSYGVYATIRNY
jgi:DUF1680 family protein